MVRHIWQLACLALLCAGMPLATMAQGTGPTVVMDVTFAYSSTLGTIASTLQSVQDFWRQSGQEGIKKLAASPECQLAITNNLDVLSETQTDTGITFQYNVAFSPSTDLNTLNACLQEFTAQPEAYVPRVMVISIGPDIPLAVIRSDVTASVVSAGLSPTPTSPPVSSPPQAEPSPSPVAPSPSPVVPSPPPVELSPSPAAPSPSPAVPSPSPIQPTLSPPPMELSPPPSPVASPSPTEPALSPSPVEPSPSPSPVVSPSPSPIEASPSPSPSPIEPPTSPSPSPSPTDTMSPSPSPSPTSPAPLQTRDLSVQLTLSAPLTPELAASFPTDTNQEFSTLCGAQATLQSTSESVPSTRRRALLTVTQLLQLRLALPADATPQAVTAAVDQVVLPGLVDRLSVPYKTKYGIVSAAATPGPGLVSPPPVASPPGGGAIVGASPVAPGNNTDNSQRAAPAPSPSDSSSANTTAIVVGVVVPVVVLTLLALALLAWWRQKRQTFAVGGSTAPQQVVVPGGELAAPLHQEAGASSGGSSELEAGRFMAGQHSGGIPR